MTVPFRHPYLADLLNWLDKLPGFEKFLFIQSGRVKKRRIRGDPRCKASTRKPPKKWPQSFFNEEYLAQMSELKQAKEMVKFHGWMTRIGLVSSSKFGSVEEIDEREMERSEILFRPHSGVRRRVMRGRWKGVRSLYVEDMDEDSDDDLLEEGCPTLKVTASAKTRSRGRRRLDVENQEDLLGPSITLKVTLSLQDHPSKQWQDDLLVLYVLYMQFGVHARRLLQTDPATYTRLLITTAGKLLPGDGEQSRWYTSYWNFNALIGLRIIVLTAEKNTSKFLLFPRTGSSHGGQSFDRSSSKLQGRDHETSSTSVYTSASAALLNLLNVLCLGNMSLRNYRVRSVFQTSAKVASIGARQKKAGI
ncbi:hypothetical protein F5878DRAFT_642286 [Lentinula raphanica]|uniref:Uncharacterized protein n=1 Tax=Lentinula raphanica TaxID=153919 RepID=A0AA38UH58_9AGAR|nr:hypothetical protein F5878DRAFT_642286 [Lentinula raphanica]